MLILRDVFNTGTVDILKDKPAIEIPNIDIDDLTAKVDSLYGELRSKNNAYISLLKEVDMIKNKFDSIEKDLEKVKNGCIDPDSDLRRINKDMSIIERRISNINENNNLDDEIRKLNELSIKSRSFRLQKTKVDE
jgi:chromosome segregation ATPase